MAKERAGDALSIERQRVALEKLRIIEREKTRRLAIASFFGTVALGIIAWAAVRLTDKPPWLTFALALLAATGGPSLIILRAERRLAREIRSREAIFDVKSSKTSTDGDEPEGGLP